MNINLSKSLEYIKQNGLKHTIKAVYLYKLEGWYIKLINSFTKHFRLHNTIVIESHNDFDCNGGALYEYLISKGYNKKYKIIWLLKRKTNRNLPKNVKGYLIDKPSFVKAFHLCTAKYFTADNIVVPKVRNDQQFYYLTHGGITFKNVKGLLVVPEHVDYILSSSSNYDPFVCNNYSIPYPNKKMLHLGYPSNDVFFNDTPNEIEKITKDKFDKVFLWMPTFRKWEGLDRNDSTIDYPLGIPLIYDSEGFNELNSFLKKENSLMIIKLHPQQDLSTLKISSTSNIKVLTINTVRELNLNTSCIMKYADALISDYSSSAYQYILLDRPIAFVLSDLENYKLGFSVENYEDFLPGSHIYEFDNLISFLSEVVHNIDVYKDKRSALLDFLYEYKDGNACKRLVEFMNL